MTEAPSERRDYGILVSLHMREEAEVMASALRAEGIDAFVGNRHHANVDWGWTIALGGNQVFVPAGKIDQARTLIRARIQEAAEHPDPDVEPARRHDRWKVWLVIVVSFLLPVGGLTANNLDEHINLQALEREWRREGEAARARGRCGPDVGMIVDFDGQVICLPSSP